MSASRPNALVGFSCGLLLVFALVSRRRASRLEEDADPELLLVRARQGMQVVQAKNRTRMVEAITQKSILQNLVERTQRDIDVFGAEAEQARQEKNDALAEKLLTEKAGYEATLQIKLDGLREAKTLVEAAKSVLSAEEKRVRVKIARAMALKAEWQTIQIVDSVSEAVSGIQSQAENVTFGRAEARLKQERERQKSRALTEQARQTAENLADEAARARENGDAALAERLTTLRDALWKHLPHQTS